MVDRDRPVLHARQQEQVLLHAAEVQRPERDAVSQQGQRDFRECDAGAPGLYDPTSKSLGVAHAGLRQRRLDGSFRLQRHRAQQALSQQSRRYVHRRRASRPALLTAKRARCARAWERTPPTTTTPAGRAWSSAISPTKAWRFITTTDRGCLPTKLPRPASHGFRRKSLTFGTFFFDYDLDGLPDLLAVNGHVSDDVSVVQPTVKYAQPPHLVPQPGQEEV